MEIESSKVEGRKEMRPQRDGKWMRGGNMKPGCPVQVFQWKISSEIGGNGNGNDSSIVCADATSGCFWML